MTIMGTKIVNGREIAHTIKKGLIRDLEQLRKTATITPTITTITVGHDPSSEMYLKLRDNACKEIGITSHRLSFEAETSEERLLKEIQRLNTDDSVHGILIQYPLPQHLHSERVMSAVDPRKDIEGFNPMNLGKTILGEEYLVPCTPLAVLRILDHEQIPLQGKDVVIVNHSIVVGKPLTALFLNRNATVTICHVFTTDLERYTQNADILVSATGVPKLITADHVKDQAVVIDVGIIETSEGICGDVDFQTVKEKTSVITPVPGGVGPVTIACALSNMLKTYRNSLGIT